MTPRKGASNGYPAYGLNSAASRRSWRKFSRIGRNAVNNQQVCMSLLRRIAQDSTTARPESTSRMAHYPILNRSFRSSFTLRTILLAREPINSY